MPTDVASKSFNKGNIGDVSLPLMLSKIRLSVFRWRSTLLYTFPSSFLIITISVGSLSVEYQILPIAKFVIRKADLRWDSCQILRIPLLFSLVKALDNNLEG